jgi:hypothetical protein
MRLLVNGLMDYLAWQEDDAGCHWRDMVATQLKERPITFAVRPDLGTRTDRRLRELAIAREIVEKTTTDTSGCGSGSSGPASPSRPCTVDWPRSVSRDSHDRAG